MVIYCGQACQKMHWFTHKKVCKMLQEQREKQEAESAKLRMQQSKEESEAVQEATDSMQDLSVETNSEVASSDSAAESSNSTSTDNWGTSDSQHPPPPEHIDSSQTESRLAVRLKARQGLVQQETRTHIYYQAETLNRHVKKVCATAVIILSFLYFNFFQMIMSYDVNVKIAQPDVFVVEVTGRTCVLELMVHINDGM